MNMNTSRLNGQHAERPELLSRLMSLVHDMGLDEMLDYLAHVHEDGPEVTGEGRFNLIPSPHKGSCCSVAVAIARGDSRRAEAAFPKVMQRVKTHLIDCAGITKTVIVFCDTWNAAAFVDEHVDELRAHHRRGVQFFFVLAAAPGSRATLMDVQLT